jgi:hypothetical protein
MSTELFSDPVCMQEGWQVQVPALEAVSIKKLGSPVERVALVRSIRIFHPAYDSAVNMVKNTFSKCGHFSDPGGGRIIAESGGGKSSIRDMMLELHPPEDLPDRLVLPVLAFDAFPGARLGSFLDSMLGRCSFALAGAKISNDDKSNPGKMKILETALNRCQVKLILVDEFQHLGERKIGVHTKEITDGMKTLYNATHIPQIYLGEPPADLPFQQNSQFESRFPARVELHRFDFDAEFLGVMQMFDEQLPMEFQASLANANVAHAIHVATGGRMRSIVKLLAEAVFISSGAGAKFIKIEHLREAYDSIFGADPRRLNPFSSVKEV